MADAAADPGAPCPDAPAAPAAAGPPAAAVAAPPPPPSPAAAAAAHLAAATNGEDGADGSESEGSSGSGVQPETSAPTSAPSATPAGPAPPALPPPPPGHRPKQERKLCGSLGCMLFDHHPGLCQIVLESGPRQRRPAAKLVQAVAEAPDRSPRGGPTRAAAPAASAEPDRRTAGALTDSELLSLPCAAGCPPAVVAGTLALFRQWCPAATSDAESDAEDAIAHLEWAERSLTGEELSVLTRALEAEARRRLRAARRAAGGGGAGAGEPDHDEEEDCTASPSSDGDERGRRWASTRRAARPARSEPPAARPAAGETPPQHSFRASQAKPGARVVVVYEEGTARVPYGGTVRQVHRGSGMLVQFDEEDRDGLATGEAVWVSEEHGDEWWYEPGHRPPAGRGRQTGRGIAGAAAAAGAAGAGAAAAAAGLFAAPEDPAGTKRQKTLLARRQPPADARPSGAPAAAATAVDEASSFIASSGVDALLARLEAKQAGK